MDHHPPTLLNLPVELRLMIFEPLLNTPYTRNFTDFHKNALTYHNNALGPISHVMHICGQIRDELSLLYFLWHPVHFKTFAELATALLRAPSTAPFWRHVRIQLSGRKYLTATGKRWHLEPGLALLTPQTTPRLTRLVLDVGEIVVGPLFAAQSLEFEREVMFCADQIRDGLPQGLGGPEKLELVGTAVRRDTVWGAKTWAGSWTVGFERGVGGEWVWSWFWDSGF